MRLQRFKRFFILAAFFISTNAYTNIDCDKLLDRLPVQSEIHNGVEFVRPDGNVIHVLIGPQRQNGVQWLRDITKAAKTAQELQSWWTSQSMHGQVWTKHVSIPYSDPNKGFSVEMKIRDGYAFFDTLSPSHQEIWDRWQKTHSQEPNEFAPEQVRRLTEGAEAPNYTLEGPKGRAFLAVPTNSFFYKENHLVGVLVNQLRERGTPLDCWNIVNFDGIEEITIRTADSVELPSDLKHIYTFKFAP